MQQNTLGKTDIKVSKICLGTMTFGEQNTQQQASEQLDYATNNGVNFIDTAEIYAVPPREETYGKTEEMIGNWLQHSQKRNEIILATKIAGHGLPWIRGAEGFVEENISKAIDGSLKRLKTDYVDLIQLHWPQRGVQLWGKQNHHPSMYKENAFEQLESYYYALSQEQKKGKFKHIGLSNETAWGVMKYQQLAENQGLSPIVSNQNAYSIVRREYEVGLSEISLYENIGLLAYSPLAGGFLTGKYANNQMPANSRFQIFPEMMGYYRNERSAKAVAAYQQLADELNISLTQLCLSFVNDQPFVTSNIIGATTMEQLKENISSAEITLSEETRNKIDEIFTEYQNTGSW